MVFPTRILLAKGKPRARAYLKSSFRDSLRLEAVGGNGGNGYPKFGGHGGPGGDVKLVGAENVTLNDVYKANRSKRFTAPSGRHSTHNFILGTPGQSVTIKVPLGVTLLSEDGKKIGEINEENEELLIAKGGIGGNPRNNYFGAKGEKRAVVLDLKLIADIGLVGFPNAGKSTLLKAISHAKPKIASYPFTTVRPNIGIIEYKDLRQIAMADLPGLIEGAYANRGMGHRFLKHVERTKLLLLIVDINGFRLSYQYPHRSAMETILLLNKELELYNKDLLGKSAMLIINKMDTDGAKSKYEEIKDRLKNLPEIVNDYPDDVRPDTLLKFSDVMAISAKENPQDIEIVKQKVRRLLDLTAEAEKSADDERNFDLYNRIREENTERGPRLV